MAALQLGGSALGAVLNVVLDKLSTEVIGRVGSMKNIEDDISTLQISLRKIKRMLVSAEKRIENRKDDDVKDWIDKVRDVMYEVEDFLDVLVLTNVQRDKEEGSLRSFMPSFVHDVIESSNIQVIQGKVDRILRLSENYDFKNIEIIVRQPQRRVTSTIIFDGEPVVGREKEKAQVIEMLIPKSTDEKSYDVIPIIGFGGVGKTTLAQVIYNNEDVQRHFQLKIWVCVSTDFDMIRLTKEIIKSICNQSKEQETKTRTDYLESWDALQSKLIKLLKWERFLLVLDDVWDEGKDNWDEFMKPFKYGQKGSRILVTTRKSTVARIVSKNEIKLEGLPDGDLWTLFEKFAFGGSNSSGLHSRNPNLEAIGREIIKKLKGSPLAAKTVGRFLNENLNVAYWNDILESELCIVEQDKQDDRIQGKVDRILRQSEYYDFKNIEINVKQPEWRETTSILDDEVVIGREDEKAQVIQMLIHKSTYEKSYDVIPIIGLGGVGKTTLAQVIYNNEDVQKHFQLKIWVCVSNDFDKKRLTKEIIKSICNQSKEEETKTDIYNFNDDNWDALQSKLKKLLTEKRFLLVLDDVWDEGKDNWDEFMKPFRFGQKGSRILVTTRKSTVARIVSKYEIKLEGLPDGDLWTLFEKFAFGGSNSSGLHWRNPNLEAIGREIIKKLKGSPLAAKTVGRFLNERLNEAYWNDILESELCSVEQDKQDDRIQGKVDRILRQSEYYDFKNIEINVKQPEWRETTSILGAERVVGRENEKSQVLQMLFSKSTDEKSYDVIPIIGLGGVGKTTLARVIYNNDDVKTHFQLKIWVCVSNDFNKKRLTKEIIKSICNQSKEEETMTIIDYLESWDALQTRLRDLLTGKRFLLVLDDVWDERKRNWEEFNKPFQYGQKGSRILVTTRKSTVARIVSKNEIKLEGLPDGDFWTLFEKFAFGGSNSSGLHSRNPKLEAIGREIIKKLKGSPLAAKTVGRFLNENLNVAYWNDILESELWSLDPSKVAIMPALLLSYQELPDYLKPCFAFFSLFPKDHTFSRDELIRMWGAHSWIKDEEKKSTEDVGKNYWNELLSRCMIESHKQKIYRGQEESYVMHDLIHDIALLVSKSEYFCIKSEKDLLDIPKSVRHLSVYSSDAMQFEIIKYQKIFNNLRTLITSCKLDLDMIFQVAKKLRVLKVRGILDKDVPNSIQQLCHLRYLDFNYTQIRSIPDSLCELHSLQVLLLKYCRLLQNLPREMNRMVNLRHLELPEYSSADFKIKSVGNLCLLQKLNFDVSNDTGHTITELGNLNNLRELYIRNLQRVGSKEKAMSGNLKGKRHLDLLQLCWEKYDQTSNNDVAEDVIEGLQPPKNISGLRIFYYGGKKSPSWMENQSLSNLKRIYIFGCNYWSIDVSFGHLPHLVSLRIERMKAVQHLGPKFFGEGAVTGFPSLEHLRISSLENWEEWRISVDNRNTRIFPRLQTLRIAYCSKLKGIPFEISPTVSELTLCRSPNLAPISKLPPSIEYLNIEDCEKVSNSFSSAYLEGLTSLRRICIRDCQNLKSLSPSLKAVEFFSFRNCPELKLESWMQDLTCLQKLNIDNCPKAVESLLKEHIVMPSSLSELHLEGGFSGNYDLDASLPTWTQNLSSLRFFSVVGAHVASLTSWIKNMPWLSSLRIEHCQELESLDLQSLINLKSLGITNCPKLSVSSTTLPSQLKILFIAEVSLVQLKEWLILLSSTCQELNYLSITRCPELIYFDVDMDDALLKLGKLEYLRLSSCCSCQSLPTQLYKFPSLHSLWLSYCPNLRSLPVNGLPSSLKELRINDCPMLREQCKKGGGEWHKISHIKDKYMMD